MKRRRRALLRASWASAALFATLPAPAAAQPEPPRLSDMVCEAMVDARGNTFPCNWRPPAVVRQPVYFPSAAEIAFDQGWDAFQRRDWDTCIEAFTRVTSLEASNEAAWHNLGACNFNGRARSTVDPSAAMARARVAYERAYALQADEVRRRSLALWWEESARIAQNRGDYAGCVADTRRSVAYSGTYHQAFARRARCLLASGRLDEADAAALAAARLVGDGSYGDLRGTIALRRIQGEVAAEEASLAERLDALRFDLTGCGEAEDNYQISDALLDPDALAIERLDDLIERALDNVGWTVAHTLRGYHEFCDDIPSYVRVRCQRSEDVAWFEASCGTVLANAMYAYVAKSRRVELTDAERDAMQWAVSLARDYRLGSRAGTLLSHAAALANGGAYAQARSSAEDARRLAGRDGRSTASAERMLERLSVRLERQNAERLDEIGRSRSGDEPGAAVGWMREIARTVTEYLVEDQRGRLEDGLRTARQDLTVVATGLSSSSVAQAYRLQGGLESFVEEALEELEPEALVDPTDDDVARFDALPGRLARNLMDRLFGRPSWFGNRVPSPDID